MIAHSTHYGSTIGGASWAVTRGWTTAGLVVTAVAAACDGPA